MTQNTDNRPAYVRQMDAQRKAAEAERDALLEGLYELRAYLNLPKYRDQASGGLRGLVNVEDVLMRLNETTLAGVVAADRANDPVAA
jgi:hypothetical protein